MTNRSSSRKHRFSRRPRRGTACVLVSGGLDSVVLLRDFLRRYRVVQPLYVRAGLRWEKAEIEALRRVLRALRRPGLCRLAFVDVPMRDLYGRHWSITGGGTPGFRAADESVYLPGRNLALLSKAAIFCALHGFELLASGVLASNPFPDATPGFFRALESALRRGLDTPLRIASPYLGLTKAEVIRKGRDLPLELTLSCASPRGGRHCGRCSKCAERVQAFRRAGVPDPTGYVGGPGASGLAPRAASRESARTRPRITRVAPEKATRLR